MAKNSADGPFIRLVYGLDRLHSTAKRDFSRQLLKTRELLQEVLDDKRWLARYCRSFSAPTERYFVYRRQGAYGVLAQIFSPGVAMPVHDHKAWGLVGVFEGEEREERYRRLDDGRTDKRARLLYQIGRASCRERV